MGMASCLPKVKVSLGWAGLGPEPDPHHTAALPSP